MTTPVTTDLNEFIDNNSGYTVQDSNSQINSQNLVSNYSKDLRKKQMSSNFESVFGEDK